VLLVVELVVEVESLHGLLARNGLDQMKEDRSSQKRDTSIIA